MGKMTPKQLRFCEEYIIDLNITQAAIRAEYSEKTAYSIGQRLLKNVEVQKCISNLQKKLQQKTGITAERVIEELAKIAFHNTQDFVNGGNSILEIKHLDRDKTAAVSKIKTTVKEDGTTISEIGFYDKVEALEKLGKHLGIFEKDNKQKENAVNLNLNLSKDEVNKISQQLEDKV